jgi:hypothetical protein
MVIDWFRDCLAWQFIFRAQSWQALGELRSLRRARARSWLPGWLRASRIALRRHDAAWLPGWLRASRIALRRHDAAWLPGWLRASRIALRRHDAAWLVESAILVLSQIGHSGRYVIRLAPSPR